MSTLKEVTYRELDFYREIHKRHESTTAHLRRRIAALKGQITKLNAQVNRRAPSPGIRAVYDEFKNAVNIKDYSLGTLTVIMQQHKIMWEAIRKECE